MHCAQQRKALAAHLNREGKLGSLSNLRLIATESGKGVEQDRFSVHPSLKEGEKYQYLKAKIIELKVNALLRLPLLWSWEGLVVLFVLSVLLKFRYTYRACSESSLTSEVHDGTTDDNNKSVNQLQRKAYCYDLFVGEFFVCFVCL